jgi:hypothetical protein
MSHVALTFHFTPAVAMARLVADVTALSRVVCTPGWRGFGAVTSTNRPADVNRRPENSPTIVNALEPTVVSAAA